MRPEVWDQGGEVRSGTLPLAGKPLLSGSLLPPPKDGHRKPFLKAGFCGNSMRLLNLHQDPHLMLPTSSHIFLLLTILVAQATMTSLLDSCNNLLSGPPASNPAILQPMVNRGAREIFFFQYKSDCVFSFLKHLNDFPLLLE